jgi:hypothetical protein
LCRLPGFTTRSIDVAAEFETNIPVDPASSKSFYRVLFGGNTYFFRLSAMCTLSRSVRYEGKILMTENLSAEVRECLDHAGYYAERAGSETDPAIQSDFLEMEKCWLQMASSYRLLAWLQSSPSDAERRGQLSDRLEQLKRELARQRPQTVSDATVALTGMCNVLAGPSITKSQRDRPPAQGRSTDQLRKRRYQY